MTAFFCWIEKNGLNKWSLQAFKNLLNGIYPI